jgi:hypothetical protein
MVGQRKQPRGWMRRFIGPRVNCEYVPCLPAKALSWVLDDPRRIPYLMIWKDEDSDEVLEAVRVTAYKEPGAWEMDWAGCVEIKRTNGNRSWIRTIQRPMPRNGGKSRLVICPRCQRPRRALYPWRLNPSKPCAAFVSTWQCRSCARLRYASEGGALKLHPRTDLGRFIEAIEGPSQHPRPESCYPYVFANPNHVKAFLSGR